MRSALTAALTLLLCTMPCAAARKALVIGNATYAADGMETLAAPINDAEDIGARLSTMGFAVEVKPDLKRDEFRRAISAFVASLAPADTALFYYAGHAIQVNGQNFLWPVDRGVGDEFVIEENFVSVQTLYDGLRQAGTSVNIIILDACRENPFAPTPSGTFIPGLALPRATPDSAFIAYATKENSVAIAVDVGPETRKRSPYTNALLSQIGRTGVPITQIFGDVRNIVAAVTGQIPVVENTLNQVFYFRPPVTVDVRLRDTDDAAIVMLDGVEQFSTLSGGGTRSILLHGGENRIDVKVFNQRSFTGGIEFFGGRRPEGWRYRATFRRPGADRDLLPELSASENEPERDGPRHGQLFTAATFSIFVDDESGAVRVDDDRVDRDAWKRAGAAATAAPPGVLTDVVRADLEWAKNNSGNPGCPGQYLPHADCLLIGQRSCLIRRAAALARQGSVEEAFRLALVTQCENAAAQSAMRHAGIEVVTAWLRQLE